ncbi:hypothetical protein ACFE04_026635 [Oxalis oulophora]
MTLFGVVRTLSSSASSSSSASASGFSIISSSDQRNAISINNNWILKSNSLSIIASSSYCLLRFSSTTKRCRIRHRHRQPKWISCNSSSSPSIGDADHHYHHHDEFYESSLLISETLWHYRSVNKGFREDMKWQPFNHLPPFSLPATGPRPDLSLLGQTFLRRFPNPTFFLKVSCHGDFLLPISVGEFAIEKLVDASRRDNNNDSEGCPDLYQFVSNVAQELGYQIKMVKITRRVVNTYFAELCFSKAGENEILSVDMRPSDAINVAYRCKAPIYVSKQVLLEDAIRISYGMGRPQSRKSPYDVTLDSAADGPDLLSEELRLVNNMNLASEEERYNDAAMLRDKLTKLRKSEHEHS